VVDYLARYTRRIAISNARILAVDDEHVTLRYKDYRDRDRHKPLVLEGTEFVRRFLLHVLPKELMRVRHYGFLANRCRRRRLAQIRRALAVVDDEAKSAPLNDEPPVTYTCPHCHKPTMQVIGAITAQRTMRRRPANHKAHRYRP